MEQSDQKEGEDDYENSKREEMRELFEKLFIKSIKSDEGPINLSQKK